MKRGLPIERCDACGHAVFPPRLACPDCGARAWRPDLAETGVAEQITVVRHAIGRGGDPPSAIASVRADVGPLLVARVEPGLRPGCRVELWRDSGVLRALPAEPAE